MTPAGCVYCASCGKRYRRRWCPGNADEGLHLELERRYEAKEEMTDEERSNLMLRRNALVSMKADVHRKARMSEGLSAESSPWNTHKRGHTIGAQALSAKRSRLLGESMEGAPTLDAGLGGGRAPPMPSSAPQPTAAKAAPVELTEEQIEWRRLRNLKKANQKKGAPKLITVNDQTDRARARRMQK